MQTGQKTQAPRSMVRGDAEIACVGQASTHIEQPSGQRAVLMRGLPRKRAGVEAVKISVITDWPSANLTFTAFGKGIIFFSGLGWLSHNPWGAAAILIS